jgi:tRNA1Val (adenine37-N6)-methyltransferase
MDEETLDEILEGRIRIFQKKKGYRFSIDVILLSHFISLKPHISVIDLGTGSGIIPIILSNHYPHIQWLGLEIQEHLAALALKNVDLNGLKDRIRIIKGDVRKIEKLFPAHSFDAIVFNPPYRKMNSGRINPLIEKAIARHEIKGSLKEFLQAARYLARTGGKIFTIFPAKRLAELICLFRENKIEPKRMKMVFSDEDKTAEFVLVEGRAEGSEELKIEPSIFIYDQEKRYTKQMQAIFSELARLPADGAG